MGPQKDTNLKIAGFVRKLLQIFKSKKSIGIIDYDQDKRSFSIRNVRKFTQQILPIFFNHQNLSSFVRQANLYDFHKIHNEQKQQKKHEAYSNQNFDINNPKLLKKIRRKITNTQRQKKQRKRVSSQQSQLQQQNHQSKQMNKLIQKRQFIKGQIKIQQQANAQLKSQNQRIKFVSLKQNQIFYKELLKILQNILLAQVKLSTISQNLCQSIQKLIFRQMAILDCQLAQIFDNKKQNTCINDQSQFLIYIKKMFNENQNTLTISQLISFLQEFQLRQNHKFNLKPRIIQQEWKQQKRAQIMVINELCKRRQIKPINYTEQIKQTNSIEQTNLIKQMNPTHLIQQMNLIKSINPIKLSSPIQQINSIKQIKWAKQRRQNLIILTNSQQREKERQYDKGYNIKHN